MFQRISCFFGVKKEDNEGVTEDLFTKRNIIYCYQPKQTNTFVPECTSNVHPSSEKLMVGCGFQQHVAAAHTANSIESGG
jgi:hypothetical protein